MHLRSFGQRQRLRRAQNTILEHGGKLEKTSVTFRGVHLLSVKGVDGGGNSAVAVGDRLYYTDADTPPISKKATGRPVGFAVETETSPGTVSSGATTTIPVLLATF